MSTSPAVDALPLPPTPPDSPAIQARAWRGAGISAAILAGAALGALRLFFLLKAIDNSPETYKSDGPWIATSALICGVVAAAFAIVILAAAPRDGARHLRRAAATALIALPVGFLLWWAPTPFGLTRILTFIVLAFAAARLAIASLRPTTAGTPTWLPPLAAVAAGALALRVLLLIKLNESGWAYAID